MHREKQNTIFNNIFLLWSMQAWECYRLLGAVAVMFFGQKVQKSASLQYFGRVFALFTRRERRLQWIFFFSVILVRETVEGYLELPKTVLKIKWRLPKSAFMPFWMRLRSLIDFYITCFLFYTHAWESNIYLEVIVKRDFFKNNGGRCKTSRNKRMLM